MASDLVPVRFNGVVGMAMRRWYIVVIGLLLSLSMSYLTAQHVDPRYTMKASVVLLVPEKAVGAGGNPYLALGGLEAAVDVVATGLSSDAIQEEVARTGATSAVVARDASTSAPILLITVQGPSRPAAAAGVKALLDAVPPTLASIQRSAGVDQSQLIRLEVVAASRRPVVSHKPQIRAALIVLLAASAATLLVTALVDTLVRRWRRRRALRASQSGDAHRQPPGLIDVAGDRTGDGAGDGDGDGPQTDDERPTRAVDLLAARNRKR